MIVRMSDVTPSPSTAGQAATQRIIARVDEHLSVGVGTLDLPKQLDEAVRYALLGGGKRTRPVLAWHSAVAVGGLGEASLGAGAAVELVHAFSLVHDDLPAMDDDDMRRGRPTLHIHSGEAMAILAGDVMLASAYSFLENASAGQGALAQALTRELTAATKAMITGQVYDTMGGLPGELSDADRLGLIHRNKTGALIRAACRMGAMCGLGEAAAGGAEALAAITAYADAVGLQFQVVDDLLDVEQTSEQIGKAAGKDAGAGKLTFPGVHGVAGSKRVVLELHDAAIAALEPLGDSADGLRQVATALAQRTT